MKNKIIFIFVILAGVYFSLDGFISILLYPEQTFFPDHCIRLIRVIVGIVLIMIAGNKFSSKD